MEKQKKVLFVVSGIAFSGAEKVLEDYVDNTSKIEPFFIFYFSGNAYDHFKEKYNNVFLLDLKYNKIKLCFFPNLYNKYVNEKIRIFVKENNIQKVFFNNTLEGLLGYSYIKENPESIYEIHDMSDTFKNIYKRKLIARTIESCNNTVTVSNACKNSWKNKIKYVIYNGVNFLKELDIEEKKNIITYIGNSTKRKGSDICVKVAKYFEKSNNIDFIMIFGDQVPNVDYPSNVKVYCNLERNKVFDILKESKILFLPTRKDPFPTVILEGELYNNIIIANKVDGIPEMVPNAKFLSNNNSINDYVKYIEEIISMSNSEIDKITSQQQEFIKKFDIRNKVDMFDELI